MIGQEERRLLSPQAGHRDLSNGSVVIIKSDVLVQVTNAFLATFGNVDRGGDPVTLWSLI